MLRWVNLLLLILTKAREHCLLLTPQPLPLSCRFSGRFGHGQWLLMINRSAVSRHMLLRSLSCLLCSCLLVPSARFVSAFLMTALWPSAMGISLPFSGLSSLVSVKSFAQLLFFLHKKMPVAQASWFC